MPGANLVPNPSNLLGLSKRLSGSDFTNAWAQPLHPIHEKLMKLQAEHHRNQFVDPLTIKFKNFPVEPEIPQPKPSTKMKISEWNDQEVLLPILGKNKTCILHVADQFEHECISRQKVYHIQPRIRN